MRRLVRCGASGCIVWDRHWHVPRTFTACQDVETPGSRIFHFSFFCPVSPLPAYFLFRRNNFPPPTADRLQQALLRSTWRVMGLLEPSTVEWWLPAGYLLFAALAEILWKARSDQGATSSKRNNNDDEGALDSAAQSHQSLRAPLLQESGGEYIAARLYLMRDVEQTTFEMDLLD